MKQCTNGNRILSSSPRCKLFGIDASYDYKYYQKGDVMIGGLFTVNKDIRLRVFYHLLHKRLVCAMPSTREYVGLLTFIFAINEINQDPDLLPNVTLGYHIYDTCGDGVKSFQNILQILSGDEIEAPNYSCGKHGEVVGFVGHSYEQAQFLDIYGYPMFPQSRCNEKCSPGYRKAQNERHLVCCYDCVLCSEGEISNISDSEICHKCPSDHWPDERKVKCLPKEYEFLSYKSDSLALVFSGLVLLFSVITGFILGLFILHWDTPIVKANNRTLSITLLVSLLLSFLCVFFFLGRPVDITCMLRQISFSLFFSIAVSSVLSKTMIVCIAFKVTKPRSPWRKWMGHKIPNFTPLICSIIPVLICAIWLVLSPPYQEYDFVSYAGKIIIQCNEGSVIAFYSVLGYMGFLAAVSFVLAFMVRTLPDSFNEAKYITFSMLVFCSVWITMIPAYLSTRGKYMVAVEIFAILTSSAGILVCIFFPKCYIMLLKPELNIRKKVLQKISSKVMQS